MDLVYERSYTHNYVLWNQGLFKMYSCYVLLEIDIVTVCANGHRYRQIADHNVATTMGQQWLRYILLQFCIDQYIALFPYVAEHINTQGAFSFLQALF